MSEAWRAKSSRQPLGDGLRCWMRFGRMERFSAAVRPMRARSSSRLARQPRLLGEKIHRVQCALQPILRSTRIVQNHARYRHSCQDCTSTKTKRSRRPVCDKPNLSPRTFEDQPNTHLPFPYGRETTGYEVADLDETLAGAKSCRRDSPHRAL